METENPPYSNANSKTILTAVYIVVLTCLVLFFLVQTKNRLDNTKRYYAVHWKNADTVVIKPGPVWFYYDDNQDSLKSLKRISEQEKLHLLNLGPDSGKGRNSFINAVNQLAFKSNYDSNRNYPLFLLLTALCGMVGVLLRTVNNFIGVTCIKKNFDFSIWWPWYFVRPIMGSFIGPIFFLLVDGNLFVVSSDIGYTNMAVISLTILAGYGAEDFFELLRRMTKRIFGTGNGTK